MSVNKQVGVTNKHHQNRSRAIDASTGALKTTWGAVHVLRNAFFLHFRRNVGVPSPIHHCKSYITFCMLVSTDIFLLCFYVHIGIENTPLKKREE